MIILARVKLFKLVFEEWTEITLVRKRKVRLTVVWEDCCKLAGEREGVRCAASRICKQASVNLVVSGDRAMTANECFDVRCSEET